MDYPQVADTYLKVKDMDRAVRFYEAFLGVEPEYRYRDRWTSITSRLGLYNPVFDLENDVPLTKYDRNTRMGNNVVVVFVSGDLENEHARVQSLGATAVTEIMEVNLVAPYRFFQFQDPEGNVLEVGQMA
jgi:predicted enzyme related to lactoylglutathione lyase